jgi:hypothetical protein
MAGTTYGAAGTNTYTIPNVAGFFSNEVNAATGASQVYLRASGGLQQQSVGIYNPTTNAFTPTKNNPLTPQAITQISSASGISAIKNASTQTTTKALQTSGATPQAAQAQANKLLSPNTATADPNAKSPNSAAQQNINKVTQGIGDGGVRPSYPNLRYPEKMKGDQDCIIFNMLRYVPSKLNLSNIPTSKSVLEKSESTAYIGSVTMAIQSPISDMNSVGWTDDSMDPAKALGAAAALATISGGADGATSFAKEVSGLVTGQNKALQTAAAAHFTGAAIQNQNILARTTGSIANPNLELLFTGPILREFTFTFLLSPREESESIIIKRIIRFFKQGMSVKTASTGLFLKAPNTFKLIYKQKGDDAKFLPKIKECALQNFGVNYTPAQNYSTFNNNSMTAYELTMTFKELTPIYDSDYTALDGDADTYIGY